MVYSITEYTYLHPVGDLAPRIATSLLLFQHRLYVWHTGVDLAPWQRSVPAPISIFRNPAFLPIKGQNTKHIVAQHVMLAWIKEIPDSNSGKHFE
jgi:hypothetical protein